MNTRELEHSVAKTIQSKYKCEIVIDSNAPYTLYKLKDIAVILDRCYAGFTSRLDKSGIYYVQEETKGGQQSITYVTYGCLLNLVSRSRSPNAIDLAKNLGMTVMTKHFSCIEADTIKCIMETFKDREMSRQYRVNTYFIDLYFINEKLAIECDEPQHNTPTGISKDSIRQTYIENSLGCTFIRYSPYSQGFNMYNVLNQISTYLANWKETIRIDKEKEQQILREENAIIGSYFETDVIYLYNIGVTPTQLIIDYTWGIKDVLVALHELYPNSKLEYVMPSAILSRSIQLKSLFGSYWVEDSIYQMSADDAKNILNHINTFLKLMQDSNSTDRSIKLAKICDMSQDIITESSRKITFDEGTQTDLVENPYETFVSKNPVYNAKFDNFIEEHCVLHEHAEVNAKDIVGRYRILAREAKNETTVALTDYLKRRFKYDRLKVQTTDKVSMGYIGVMLKPIEYTPRFPKPHNIETFVFDKCVFRPGATALMREIAIEYAEWKRHMEIPTTPEDESELKQYLKTSPDLLFETVWTIHGNGQGFYGLTLKRDEKISRMSTTANKVEKIDQQGNVLSKYVSIAKAAEEEGMSAAKMSRSIKNRTLFTCATGDYYYTKSADT